jgi:hypothetical protein
MDYGLRDEGQWRLQKSVAMVVEPSQTTTRRSRFRCTTDLLLLAIGVIAVQVVLANFGLSTRSDNGIPQPSTLKGKARIPDGTFNGYPVYYHEKNTKEKEVYSSAHCVGENYQQELSWMHRSCHYSFLCFDTKEKDFVVFQEPKEKELLEHLKERPILDASQSSIRYNLHNNSVSLGGVNLKWTMNDYGVPRLKWSPRVVESAPFSFYTLPEDVVLVPFHSLSGSNPGHLVWDDFLPVYTLLGMFQLLDNKEPLMLRYTLADGRGLWGSCDFRKEKKAACKLMHKKFYPMMNQNSNSMLTTNVLAQFNVTTPDPKSHLICARHGVAGIGSLTDHGTGKTHGWEPDDYRSTHNHGRGGLFWNFRLFAMRNVGVVDEPMTVPYRIIFSLESSTIANRKMHFETQIKLFKKSFDPKEVVVESYSFKDYSLKKQIEIASRASIFITGCGGGAVTATFLPKGASVFLYYAEDGGVAKNKRTGTPARLDWDLFNNLGYLRVHWIPRTLSKSEEAEVLINMVEHELEIIKRGM